MRRCLLFFYIVCLITASCYPSPSFAEIRNGMEADVVLGQPDFNSSATGLNRQRFNSPRGAFTDGRRLIVPDRQNDRVLIWQTMPKSNFDPADVVIGAQDFNTNNGGTTQSRLDGPFRAFVESDRLYVVEPNNNRVLIWNAVPEQNLAPADIVVGQPDFTTSSASTTNSKFNFPTDVYVYQNRMFIADFSNNRVVVWNDVPKSSSVPADYVIGQSSFTSGGAATTQHGFNGPVGVVVVDDKLVISDSENNRILIWDGAPSQTGTPADYVLGQPNFTSGTSGTSASQFFLPGYLATDGKRLFVAEEFNDRVVVWNSLPPQGGLVDADYVLGHDSFYDATFGTSRTTMRNPIGVSLGGKHLVVTDSLNQRILVYNIGESTVDNLPPQFSQGKGVLGKVFWDSNENGIQDGGEKGIEGVKVASDTGIYAITDEDGKYHYPYIETGQRVLKVDESTLEVGSVLTTDNPRKVTVTEGILTKVSFGVNPKVSSLSEPDSRFRGDAVLRSSNDGVSGNDGEPLLKVSASQDPLDVSKTLSVTHDWKDDSTVDFKITCNYRLFVSSAEILLYDKTQNLIQTIALPHPLPYKHSLDFNQQNLDPNTIHFYQLKVYDKDGASDVTSLAVVYNSAVSYAKD